MSLERVPAPARATSAHACTRVRGTCADTPTRLSVSVQLCPPGGASVVLRAQTLTSSGEAGKEIEFDIEPTDTVKRIKERVEEKEGIPPPQQVLGRCWCCTRSLLPRSPESVACNGCRLQLQHVPAACCRRTAELSDFLAPMAK